MSTLQELFLKGTLHLKGVPHPHLEAKVLLLKCTSLTEEQFLSSPERPISIKEERCFFKLIAKRLARFPVPYLTGKKEFWSIPFRVFPGVFIPRPETELLVEKALNHLAGKEEILVDIGTGCGNIAISLAKELPQARIIATDFSRKAIRVATVNASELKIENIIFVCGRLFSPLKKLDLREKCDLIVSNPPYVSEKEWEGLDQEIRDHEPKKALVAGQTGLEFIKKLIRGAPSFLKTNGHLLLEIGEGQLREILALFDARWNEVTSFNDLRGIPRVVLAKRK